MISDKLPIEIVNTAFRMRSEYAWKRSDLPEVFRYFVEHSLAILCGEAWVVRALNEQAPDEPTGPIDNLSARRRTFGDVLGRAADHVILGSFPLRTGDLAMCAWNSSDRNAGERWSEYARRTVREAEDAIERADLENVVISRYAENVYYNLDCVDEQGYDEIAD